MSALYWLTDEQMARLQPFFPKSNEKLGSTIDERSGALSSSIVSGCAGVMRRRTTARARRSTFAESGGA